MDFLDIPSFLLSCKKLLKKGKSKNPPETLVINLYYRMKERLVKTPV